MTFLTVTVNRFSARFLAATPALHIQNPREMLRVPAIFYELPERSKKGSPKDKGEDSGLLNDFPKRGTRGDPCPGKTIDGEGDQQSASRRLLLITLPQHPTNKR